MPIIGKDPRYARDPPLFYWQAHSETVQIYCTSYHVLYICIQ